MDYYFGNFKDVKIEEVQVRGSRDAYIQWLITRQHGNEKYAVRHFIIKPKGIIAHHKHKYTETLVILKGKGKVCANGDAREVKYGDFVFINSDVPHELINENDEDFEFICIISYEDDMRITPLQDNCGKHA
ncbi:cupin [Sulfolobus sp. A20]|uniref:cupin domain-containing protein n=1 Tax=Sulfolobaceae TaxID=118883 RepID=UPI000845C5EF|nr:MULTISPECIES: cupin domain-containing protein [unclassified Sulfolobus]TRM73928.1 cupin domain-containing protein [Sulfolobus sp. E5]TRM75286.1 cupin domain-containing protein [Sulfolobus sp. A20-N-F8]TRM76738.1 cupin domain-containing protein [Sulfolobus sp. B5]TRM83388.1 cupin domain-containing protein [Sulfolobus sp. F3]TRM84173.1 cupin domain-containing protein [Sulfolobus sp. A20-N-F6]TRM87285.1 cupin domain-containing protein [Sulfolobus sp. E3]TRM88666.1 cupin domain-containing pro